VLNADDPRETQPTLGFQRVLQRAVLHVQSSGNKEVTGANVLVAIFGEQESQAVFLLKQQEISRLDVVNFISHGISKVSEEQESLRRKTRRKAPKTKTPNRWKISPAISTNWRGRAGLIR
jgi:ATP-dependent Clp protease ATP-binding subunit ClpA